MRSEIPIISANVTSMPEIAGDAALYVNPFKIEEIKNAMLKIVADEKLRNELVEKGKIQSQKFSWDKSADQLWQCIEKTLNS
jgi:glycosyltransferase involved in cell wall biosynthesis